MIKTNLQLHISNFSAMWLSFVEVGTVSECNATTSLYKMRVS